MSVPRAAGDIVPSWVLFLGIQDIELGEESDETVREAYDRVHSLATDLVNTGELCSLAQALRQIFPASRPTQVFTPPDLFEHWLTDATSRIGTAFTFCEKLSAEIGYWVYTLHEENQPIPEAPPVHDLTLLLLWLFLHIDAGEIENSIRIECRNDRSATAASLRRACRRTARGVTIKEIPPDRLCKALFLGLARGVVHASHEVNARLEQTVYPAPLAAALAEEFLSKSTTIRGARGDILVFHGDAPEGHRHAAELAPLADTDAVLTYEAFCEAAFRRVRRVRRASRKIGRNLAVASLLHAGESVRSIARALLGSPLSTSEDLESARRMVTAIKSKELVHGCPCSREYVRQSNFSQG